MNKLDKHIKIITNSMLLIILLGVLTIPAISGGMMRLTKENQVLSSQSVRPDLPTSIKTTKIKNKALQNLQNKQRVLSGNETTATPTPNADPNLEVLNSNSQTKDEKTKAVIQYITGKVINDSTQASPSAMDIEQIEIEQDATEQVETE